MQAMLAFMVQSPDPDRLKAAAREVIERAGGASALARELQGLTKSKTPTRQAVAQWSRVPDRFVLACEQLSGVSRHQIRPDVFGQP